MLFGNIRLGALGRHADHSDAAFDGGFELALGADAGDEQGRDLGTGGGGAGFLDEVHLRRAGNAILHGRTGQAIAVRNLDHRHSGRVERLDDIVDLFAGELVGHGMGAIAQGGIDDSWSFHDWAAFPLSRCRANNSPVWRAAAVITSRLPAYFGR